MKKGTKPVVALLIVENRETLLMEFSKFLVMEAWQRNIDGLHFWRHKRKPIWFMRRELIREALVHKEVTHVLFIDTDVIPPKDYLQRLIAHDKDIVSGVYCGLQGEPCSLKDGKHFMGKGLCEVDTFSMGLSLLTRKLCEEIEYPEPNPTSKIDADVEFCKLVREKGYKIYQDFDIRGDHLLLGKF